MFESYKKVKVAAVVIIIIAAVAGGVVVFAQNRNGENDVVATFAPPATMPPIIEFEYTYVVSEVHDDYEVYDDPVEYYEEYEPYPYEECTFDAANYAAVRIPTGEPGVYRAPMISLTFDDGPIWLTNYLLDILDEHGGRVTFCVLGDMVENGADIVLRAFEAGHEIVGHSWDHRDMAQLSVEAIVQQILDTAAIIEYATGHAPPPIFRPPFGHFNRRIQQAAYETGHSALNWSIDPRDWRDRCEYIIHDHIMYHARDGAIVLLHDIHPTTIYAMRRTIPELIEMGFELVTATEIIDHVYGGLMPGYEFTGTRR
ncbi:MAG: polysaccharide deacetylase family protein [Defluviitaleaceae bacterium]|nr:polysaccharide deacetylase family protein [Defluviitaleaceae bacterium]